MINVTIDGKKIEVNEGTTVLNAARQAGIEIPTLCDHPQLTPYGGCRLCLVDVEGARTLQPSCTLPATNNMVVKTDTEKIREARKFVLTMLFSERNHFCPYCQVSGGDCELQNAAYAEGMTHWPLQPNWQPYPMDASHPFIILEHNRCILCRRCVRACGELIGNFTLGFEERGAESKLVADLSVPLGESSCISCGTCVQVCPTGALIDRWSAYQGKELDLESTETICVGCSVGCGINVLTRDNRLVRIEGRWDAQQNHGVICDIGRFYPMVEDRERIYTPMIRKNGNLKAATWQEALDDIRLHFKPLLENESSTVKALISSRLPLESLNYFKQIFNGKYQLTTLSTIENDPLLSDKMEYAKLSDLEDADCFFVFGEDITKDHQVVSFLIKRKLPAGAKLVTLNTENDGLDLFAHYPIKVHADKLDEYFQNLADVIQSDEESSLSKFEIEPGISNSALEALNTSSKLVFVIGQNPKLLNPQIFSCLEQISKSLKSKVLLLKGGANSAISINGKKVKENNPEKYKAVYIALGDEKLSQAMQQKLENIPYLVVQSSYISPLTANASVVLPVHNWLEQNGHYLSMDGNVQEAHAALIAPEGVNCNSETLKSIAQVFDVDVNNDWKSII